MGRIDTLILRNLTRQFGTTVALHDFNLSIAGGTFVTLLGPSGCGKTTALNCVAGLLDLTAGEILLNQVPIHQQPAEKRGFGMVFQNYALFPHLNAARNVAYGLELRRVRRAERAERVQRALAMVHLEAYGKRYPAQLSGGQQQRLAIARTLVLEPSLLLLDEPLSNLDANLRTEMRIEIKRIHTNLGLTTLYVTHDQTEALTMSDQVVVMRLGAIEQIGTPQTIYTQPNSLYVAAFMGYANRLSGTIMGQEGSQWHVQTTAGTRLLGTSPVGDTFQPGQSVALCCRPDETTTDPLQSVNQLQGTVQVVEYIGRGFEASVRLDREQGEQILLRSPDHLTNAATVTFGVRPERLLIYPVESEIAQLASLNGNALPPVPVLSE